jgi:hypothetical protein
MKELSCSLETFIWQMKVKWELYTNPLFAEDGASSSAIQGFQNGKMSSFRGEW